MKNLIDNYVTVVLFTFLFYLLVSFGVVQMQIVGARHLHVGVIDTIQSSYFNVSIDQINDEIQSMYPSWYVEVEPVEAVANRKSQLVRLCYEVVWPLVGIKKEGTLEGYAK